MQSPSVQNLVAQCVRTACGALADGREIDAYTLSNSGGIAVRILTLGACVQSIITPDRYGQAADIVLGYANAADYLDNPNYFGATLGRYANRIAGGCFSLDGKTHRLSANDGDNSLHGGWVGFGRQLWTASDVKVGACAGVTFTLHSAAGDEGFPGALTTTAEFELREGDLRIRYRATAQAPTIVNITNHTYFNLNGADSGSGIFRHLLTLPTDCYLPVDAGGIPTGEFRHVADSPFDFRRPTPIGHGIRDGRDEQLSLTKGYDHTWVMSRAPTPEPRLVADLQDPDSGRALQVLSDQPGLQFYSGNFLDGTAIGKGARIYRQSDGLSLEPQLFPDTPNQPAFGSAGLVPGGVYEHRLIYRLSAA